MAVPGRLVVVAAGVGSYANGCGLDDIECAAADARRFFEAVAHLAGPQFDWVHSGVFEDLSAYEFRAVVESIARSVGPRDLLVVYFSGHGEYDSGSLALVFADADIAGRGRLTSSEVGASVRHAEAVFVLDCCSSGGALHLANQTDPILVPRVSVLASSRLEGAAAFSPAGSAFTLALCRAMDALSETGNNLTLLGLASAVEDDADYGGECLSNVAEGKNDIVIAARAEGVDVPEDFAPRFLNRLLHGTRDEREMLWYGLGGVPDRIRVDVFRAWSRDDQRADPSWLVRRAAGSALGSLAPTSRARIEITTELLESTSWMDGTVGVVAVRRDVPDPAVAGQLRRIARSSQPMDLVWLAHLYLSDLGSDELAVSLDTALPETSWGAVELWERFGRGNVQESREIAERVSAVADQGVLDALATHAFLRGSSTEALPGVIDHELAGDPLVTHLYSLPTRGQLAHPAGKWLFSTLYGSWRDQVDARLLAAVRHLPPSEILRSLELVARLPAVALRMALFQDPGLVALTPGAIDAVRWGASDPHPWVRRVAVRALGTSALDAAFSNTVDRSRYPGMLDLLLEGRTIGMRDWESFAAAHELSPLEMDALAKM